MSQNYYKLYLDSVFALAETLVIKSEATAELFNNYLKASRQPVIDALPDTWKYYLNVSGEYHPTDYRTNYKDDGIEITSNTGNVSVLSSLDPAIVVNDYRKILITSLDTLEIIAFTKENLNVHKATAKAYRHGSRFFIELVAKYPNDRLLIMGILYPVDIQKAIDAPDNSIISYPKEYVEQAEYSLIHKLNDWISGFTFRWKNAQFEITDNLYMHTFLGVLYSKLVPVILNLRLAACKTDEVHSFHIRQHLASHGMLDKYLSLLTREQQLFLYRNILYIERNNGKREIFKWLTEKIMTLRQLPVAQYTMKHVSSDLSEDSLYNEIRFRKEAVNIQTNSTAIDKFSLSQVLLKETDLAKDNWLYRKDQETLPDAHYPDDKSSLKLIDRPYTDTKSILENSLSAVVATKIVESSVIDYSDATPYTMESILVNHWLLLSRAGLYTSYVQIKNPKTGSRVPVTVYEAFLYWAYACYASVYGVENPDPNNGFYPGGIHNLFKNIPNFTANRVQQIVLPSINKMMEVVDSKYVDISTAQKIKDLHTNYSSIISTESFYNKCKDIFNAAQAEISIVSGFEHHLAQGMAKNLVCQVYSDVTEPSFTAPVNYIDWMNSKNLPHEGFNRDDWLQVVASVYIQSTGLDLDTTPSIRNIQKAMVAIMEQLSSYSIQWVREVNDGSIIVLNWGSVRLGDRDGSGEHIRHVNIPVKPFNTAESGQQHIDFDLLGGEYNSFFNGSGGHYFNLEIKGGPNLDHGWHATINERLHLPPIHVTVVSDCDIGANPQDIVVPGWNSWLSINPQMRNGLTDAYCNCWPVTSDIRSDINMLITQLQGDRFFYIAIDNDETQSFKHLVPVVTTHAFDLNSEIVTLDGIADNETTHLPGLNWFSAVNSIIHFNYTGVPVGYNGFKPLPTNTSADVFTYTGNPTPLD